MLEGHRLSQPTAIRERAAVKWGRKEHLWPQEPDSRPVLLPGPSALQYIFLLAVPPLQAWVPVKGHEGQRTSWLAESSGPGVRYWCCHLQALDLSSLLRCSPGAPALGLCPVPVGTEEAESSGRGPGWDRTCSGLRTIALGTGRPQPPALLSTVWSLSLCCSLRHGPSPSEPRALAEPTRGPRDSAPSHLPAEAGVGT